MLLPIFIAVLLAAKLSAQGSYFKILEQPYTSLYQDIAQLSDGSLVVGDQLSNGLGLSHKRGFGLSRFDACGTHLWTKRYNPPDNLFFAKLEAGTNGNFYAMGTADGAPDKTFLMKINSDGEVLSYFLITGEWKDMNAYSLIYRNGRLMFSGVLRYPSNMYYGVVIMFDEDINPIWSRRFLPFNSSSESILTKDGGVLAQTGGKMIRLDNNGQLLWATQTPSSYTAPLEIETGFICENSDFPQSENQFFLLRNNGTLGWQSDRFPAQSYAIEGFARLPDGDAFYLYKCPDSVGVRPCQLRVTTDGEIFGQKRLVTNQVLSPSFMSFAMDDENNVSLVGQVNGNFQLAEYNYDFLTKFPLDGPLDSCFYWEDFEATSPASVPLNVTPITVTVEPIMVTMNLQPSFTTQSLEFVEREICPLVAKKTIIPFEKVLLCDQSWTVTPPVPGAVWEDGTASFSRQLTTPGTYTAIKTACQDTIVFEYKLTVNCPCLVYLPTAISPNGDGLNDELRPFSACSFTLLTLEIYDRWGGRLFRSKHPEDYWDGHFKGKPVFMGVYVAKLHYEAIDENGETYEGDVLQELTVVR
ncbi:MAG: gliding motility-associated C-terminal domain-containing protein [Saprospiraceae bacterium]|nr:gliding motility-associated C-terminal domain-containing protein [Saprospiraceae bacterium]MCF8251357.1 gliding motility-associated C-terminal domain-containing protein [Saprospiraceae bacterium]MCF8280532.1 gliding motility-associated C-terminal domain-containing protein [Bacteroidales bacterium]MCF8313250.1 gliding motility-associated C-terminal domain-containing protein [Saprospiraceae bacterium]MCF8441697.1 gliding motility-associated C-terminal domain-containing protein [Saprospiraceae 